jgi:hypothetical protein
MGPFAMRIRGGGAPRVCSTRTVVDLLLAEPPARGRGCDCQRTCTLTELPHADVHHFIAHGSIRRQGTVRPTGLCTGPARRTGHGAGRGRVRRFHRGRVAHWSADSLAGLQRPIPTGAVRSPLAPDRRSPDLSRGPARVEYATLRSSGPSPAARWGRSSPSLAGRTRRRCGSSRAISRTTVPAALTGRRDRGADRRRAGPRWGPTSSRWVQIYERP